MIIRRIIETYYAPVIISSLALFTMFFGAGNIIFPVKLGHTLGHHVHFGIMGLSITGALFAFLGLWSIILFDGNHHKFFGRLGKTPGFLLATLIIIILGPLAGIPRSATVLYRIAHVYFPALSFELFLLLFFGIIYFFTRRKKCVVALLGILVGPPLTIMLLSLIAQGLCDTAPLLITDYPNQSAFLYGLRKGYHTMDLLEALHFAPLIIAFINRLHAFNHPRIQDARGISVWISSIAALFLGSVYAGLSYIGAQYGPGQHAANPVALAHATISLVNPWGTNILYAIGACAVLTTSIALITICADFLHEDLLSEKISHHSALLITLAITALYTYDGLHVILDMEHPFLDIFYPPLITLTLCNIAYKLWGFRPIKTPVALVFAGSLAHFFLF